MMRIICFLHRLKIMSSVSTYKDTSWYYLAAINIPRYDHKLQIQSLLNYQF